MVDRVLPLRQAADAQRMLEDDPFMACSSLTRRHSGKSHASTPMRRRTLDRLAC
jgi:hypothetical protein